MTAFSFKVIGKKESKLYTFLDISSIFISKIILRVLILSN